MKHTVLTALFLATAAIITSSSAMAAKPISTKYIQDIITSNDLIYSHYKVTCSDGRTADISAWNNRQKWCTGKGRQDNCSAKQLNIAKEVCK